MKLLQNSTKETFTKRVALWVLLDTRELTRCFKFAALLNWTHSKHWVNSRVCTSKESKGDLSRNIFFNKALFVTNFQFKFNNHSVYHKYVGRLIENLLVFDILYVACGMMNLGTTIVWNWNKKKIFDH